MIVNEYLSAQYHWWQGFSWQLEIDNHMLCGLQWRLLVCLLPNCLIALLPPISPLTCKIARTIGKPASLSSDGSFPGVEKKASHWFYVSRNKASMFLLLTSLCVPPQKRAEKQTRRARKCCSSHWHQTSLRSFPITSTAITLAPSVQLARHWGHQHTHPYLDPTHQPISYTFIIFPACAYQ